MSEEFFQSPILNTPYAEPDRHWELDGGGQPTSIIVARRRQSSLVSPIPKARKVRGKAIQADLLIDDEGGQEYNPTEVINGIRSAVES
jgi:type III restriction enzyme